MLVIIALRYFFVSLRIYIYIYIYIYILKEKKLLKKKLQAYGVDGELLSLLEKYLENRKQRVVLNGQTSEWRKINSKVL